MPLGVSEDIFLFTQQFASHINEIEEMLTNNRIWKQRLVYIGTVTAFYEHFRHPVLRQNLGSLSSNLTFVCFHTKVSSLKGLIQEG